MNEVVAYWIVLGCLAFSAIFSVVEDIILIRKSDNVENSNRLWSRLVNDICIYGVFMTLYATRYFADIYEYLYNEQRQHLASEFVFVLLILLIWITAKIPSGLLNIITNSKSLKAIKEDLEYMILSLTPLVLMLGGYILLVSKGLIWALIPVVIAIFTVISMMLDSAYKYRNIITVKLILWVSAISITSLGLGLIAYDITSGYIFSAAMNIYPASYAANLVSVIFVYLPIIQILEPFCRRYGSQLYIPMVKEGIEELEANKRKKKDQSDEKQQ